MNAVWPCSAVVLVLNEDPSCKTHGPHRMQRKRNQQRHTMVTELPAGSEEAKPTLPYALVLVMATDSSVACPDSSSCEPEPTCRDQSISTITPLAHNDLRGATLR